MIPSEEDFHL
jgi:coiled-coil domain-containing protein 63/114